MIALCCLGRVSGLGICDSLWLHCDCICKWQNRGNLKSAFTRRLWVPALAADQKPFKQNFFLKVQNAEPCPRPAQQNLQAQSWAFILKSSPGESDVWPGLLTMNMSDFQKSYQKLSFSHPSLEESFLLCWQLTFSSWVLIMLKYLHLLSKDQGKWLNNISLQRGYGVKHLNCHSH